MKVKELPGAPWDEAYVRDLLLDDGYDLVIANGFEYTRENKQRTDQARNLLNGR